MTDRSAINGFHGDRAARRAATAKASIGQGSQSSEVFTPRSILDPLAAWWGGIALDPCGHPQAPAAGIVDEWWTGQRVPTGRQGKNGPILEWAGPGLLTPWRDRTFFNPPYDDLRPWLEWSTAQDRDKRWCGLVPVRTNRAWWIDWADDLDAIGWLPPLKFEGAEQALPLPVCLGYRGPDWAGLVCGDSDLAQIAKWRRWER